MYADDPTRSADDLVRSSITRSRFLKASGALVGFGALFGLTDTAGATSPDTTKGILDAAVTAEQIATVLYFEAIAGPTAANLGKVHDHNNLNYFQAALWQEYEHIQLLESLGGASLTGGAAPTVYFPTGSFDKADTFLALLDALENAFIGAYLAAVGYWAGQSQPVFAEGAAQIMGVESEHRALGRVTSGSNPPNNLVLEAAPFSSVTGDAVPALVPFLKGGSGYSPYAFPTETQVRAAATEAIINGISTPNLA